MQIEIDKVPANQGRLSVYIEVAADINVSTYVARRKVTAFVADEISTNMHGVEPALGEVGAIDVDVETGQMGITEALIQEGTLRATELANRS